jgi:hypothetical protein
VGKPGSLSSSPQPGNFVRLNFESISDFESWARMSL